MSQRSEDALIALRQIQRKTEQASKRLAAMAGLTPSQMVVLQLLSERGEISVGEVSKLTQLKHATITSLVDKLEHRSLVGRRRCDEDRRRVWISLKPGAEATIQTAPSLLQETFEGRFDTLPEWEQAMLVAALERVSTLLDAEDLEAAPILDVGALDEKPS